MPSGTRARSLLIADGGVPSMVALLVRKDHGAAALWTPPSGSPPLDETGTTITGRHAAAARALARWAGIDRCEQEGELVWPSGTTPHAAVLMLACDAAAKLGCDEVIWPIACGGDPDRLYALDQTAVGVERLAAVAGPSRGPAPAVSTPLIEMTAAQVADLASDLAAPLDLCWWRSAPGEGSSAEADAARWFWESMLERSPVAP